MTAATMRSDHASKIRHLAAKVETSHPTMGVHSHLRDAARALDRGNSEGAQRHMRAAISMFTPLSMMRHGHLEDDAHIAGKQHMDAINRHLLLIRDSEDASQREQARKAVHAPPVTAAGSTAQGQENAGRLMSITDAAAVYAIALELSAETAALERTPAPRGKPGGPGLYDVKGMGHTPYLQQIVKALIEKRGMPPGKAYAIARAAIRRWMRGGGHVHPEVRAAAAGAEAGELSRQARAHSHANASAESVIELFNPYHAPTGQFTTQQNAQQGQGGQQVKGKGKQPPKHMNSAQRARAKGQLLMQARRDLARAAGLRAQLRALLAQLHGHRHTGKTAPSGKTAAASPGTKAAASGTRASTPAKAGRPGAAGSGTSIQGKVSALRSQIHGLEQAAHAARAQAAKL